MSQYDIPGLYEFLSQTPEAGLRKMLVDGKGFTDIHFNMTLKVVRAGNCEVFCGHCEKKDYPQVRFNPNEIKLKDKFWDDLLKTCQSRGLLNPAQKAAA